MSGRGVLVVNRFFKLANLWGLEVYSCIMENEY